MDRQKSKATRSETSHGESHAPRKKADTQIAIIANRIDRHANTPNKNTNQRRPTRYPRLDAKAEPPTTPRENLVKHDDGRAVRSPLDSGTFQHDLDATACAQRPPVIGNRVGRRAT